MVKLIQLQKHSSANFQRYYLLKQKLSLKILYFLENSNFTLFLVRDNFVKIVKKTVDNFIHTCIVIIYICKMIFYKKLIFDLMKISTFEN